MDKLNSTEINDVLKDVRASYRLLALYQKRLLDIVKYVANAYNVSFNSGWSKFSNAALHGNKASIDKSSWDWLNLYLYEFNLGTIVIDGDSYHLKIVHQADTGFYDTNINKNIKIESIAEFADTSVSTTRLFFVISKNDNGCPIEHILQDNLSCKNTSKLIKGNWLAMPYDLQRFSSQENTDNVVNEFNNLCEETFGNSIINFSKSKKEIITLINTKHSTSLTDTNTSISNINSSKRVWWFTIPASKLNEDFNLLLNTTSSVVWIVLPKGTIFKDSFKFRNSEDKIELEISSDKDVNYLMDLKSGGTGFDFSEFVKEEIVF